MDKKEEKRVACLYRYQEELTQTKSDYIIGLDEVGRGCLAGPLVVGGVVLPSVPHILHLDDSKKITPQNRCKISEDIKKHALFFTTVFIDNKKIDSLGLSKAIKIAFTKCIEKIEDNNEFKSKAVLIDGRPLEIDKREISVVSGDSKCASIAAASIIAKIERDNYMCDISEQYQNYKFYKNKAYGTKEHRNAIKKYGLSDLHRRSFCQKFLQMSLF